MKAVAITAPRAVALVDLPEPHPGPGEVLLQVAAVGYCGSDLSTFRGGNPLVAYPRVPGHEVAGVVAAVGAGVDVAVGTRALVVPYTACGACPSCRVGRPNCCRSNQTLGVQREGALCERLVVPASALLTAPGLTLPQLALVEPVTIGFHAVARGRVAAGETVAVFGCGMVGLGAITGATARGARVIAVDVDPAKAALARACGAEELLDARVGDVAERLRALTGGDGPAAVVEAAGAPDAVRTAIEAVSFAGRVVCIGYAKQPVTYENRLVVQKELDVLGSRNAVRGDFADVVAWFATGRFPLDAVVSRRVPLADAPAALAAWDAEPGGIVKILVDVA